jgi:hypothetical protein
MRPGGWLYWIIVGLSGLTLVLVVTYIFLVQDNRTVQAEVNQRQQFINQSIQLGRVNETLIRALATAAVSNKYDRLRELLTQNGITINAAGEPTPTTSRPLSRAPHRARAVVTGLAIEHPRRWRWRLPVIIVVVSFRPYGLRDRPRHPRPRRTSD